MQSINFNIKKNFLKSLNIDNYLYCLKIKTNITTGEGSCARAGTTNDKAFYCANGAECNNFVNKACWDPVSNTTTKTLCKADEWQCKVCTCFFKKLKF